MKHRVRVLALLWFGLAAVGVLIALGGGRPVEALPEYTIRTDEPCATCHVNPGGGGSLTMRGLLWGAEGRPDEVPLLPDILIAPDISDGAELYDLACASCHGEDGAGLFGGPVADTPLNAAKIESATRRGRVRSGMPGFEGQFTEEQLQALVDYVYDLSRGEIEPAPTTYPLPPAQATCPEDIRPAGSAGVRGN